MKKPKIENREVWVEYMPFYIIGTFNEHILFS